MPLVTSTEMFKKAYEGGYAIGAFNVNNMEIVQGITEAAKELSAPLILQVSAGARNKARVMQLKDAGLRILVYTVNKPQRAAELLRWGVDCICTDAIDVIGPNFTAQ